MRFVKRPLNGWAHLHNRNRAVPCRSDFPPSLAFGGLDWCPLFQHKSGLGARERYIPACPSVVFTPVAQSQVVCRHHRPGVGMPLERALECACACADACVVRRGAAFVLRHVAGAVRCCAVLCVAVRCCALLCGDVRCCTLLCGDVRCCACARAVLVRAYVRSKCIHY